MNDPRPGGSANPRPPTNASLPACADPAGSELFWQHDKMRFSDQLAPMEIAMLQRAIGPSFTHGGVADSAPIDRVEVRSIIGYQHQPMVMVAGTPAKMAARGALAEPAVRATIGRLDEIWTTRILPEVREHLGFWDAFDLARATRSALSDHVAETWERLARVWELHVQTVLAVHLAIGEFDELYRGLFGDAGPLDSYRLLEGLPSMTVEVGQELWQLSRRALDSDEVCDVLETLDDSREILRALRRSPAGRAFVADLEAYVDRYGRRADKWTLLAPSWTEDPAPVVENLRDLVRRRDDDAPVLVTAAAAAAREQAIAAARERLESYPAAVAARFEPMLTAAQAAAVISEDHNFWIDNMTIHHLRAVLLQAGRELVHDGAIMSSSDVFMLAPEELQYALAYPGVDFRALVAERNHAMRRPARRPREPPAPG